MAQYKVPQDVEAEDKLLGPFTFRQFVYLMIAGLLIAAGVFLVLHNMAILLIIIAPPVIFLLVLALPIKKDQPMETYLSAVISYYLKPHTRIWEPGEPESTIVITAPKQTDEIRTKELDQDEAMHRLSFLADIVDTEGYAIKDSSNSSFRADVIAETNNTTDMFDENTLSNDTISQTLQTNTTNLHEEMVNQMRAAIDRSNQPFAAPTISHTLSQPAAQQPTVQPTPQPAPVYTTAEVIPFAPTPQPAAVATTTAVVSTPQPTTPAPTFGTLDSDNTAAVATPIFTPAEEPPALPANPLANSAPAPQPVAQQPVAQPVQQVVAQPIQQPTVQPAPTTAPTVAPATTQNPTATVTPAEAPETLQPHATAIENPLSEDKIENNDTIIKPDANIAYQPVEETLANPIDEYNDLSETIISEPAPEPALEPVQETQPQPIPETSTTAAPAQESNPEPSQDMIDLANNPDFSIETIAQQAKRINEKSNDKEVYISLH